VRVMVAVYTVDAAKVAGLPFHVIVPLYWAFSVMVVTGVPPVTGTVTPLMAAIVITVGAAVLVPLVPLSQPVIDSAIIPIVITAIIITLKSLFFMLYSIC